MVRELKMIFGKGIKLFLFGSPFIFSFTVAVAQDNRTTGNDSVSFKSTLSEVVVSAYEQTKKLIDQPAAISYISSQRRNRYSDISIVSAMNSVPGVRMEQRSPGSFRLNIRGSSLRSPWGVRNVKVYYNGIPFTNPGGKAYLEQLGGKDLSAIEIIKGPAGSLYGAGTGGAVLIKSALYADTSGRTNGFEVKAGAGSFGLRKMQASLSWGEGEGRSALRYMDVRSDGYRHHTRLHHRIATYETAVELSDRRTLDAFFHYSDLFYQTPGALTKQQFDENPKAARPASGIFPSAEESKAAIHQKAFLVGVKHSYQFTPAFKNTTALYGNYTDYKNPTFRNYELRKEPHFGGRTVFQYRYEGLKTIGNFFLGGEFQKGFFDQKDFGNIGGQPDTVMTFDRVDEWTAFLFAQADLAFHNGWELNVGFSLNDRKLHFTRLVPTEAADFNKEHHPVLAPRINLSKKVTPNILFFLEVSRGFSPPTLDEILPSTTELNRKLQAEKGMQYELGSKGTLFKGRLNFDINLFMTQLSQSISLRRDSSEAEYFVNAGGALQKGLETSLAYTAYQSSRTFFRRVLTWGSLTLFDFKYKDYQSGEKDYSGNRFPGTAPTSFAAGLDLETAVCLQLHLTFQHTSKIPLNDANEVYSSAYNLLGARLSYQKSLNKKIGIGLSVGGENLLNETYSLGDDINAFGGRYYNVAPAINFYGEVKVNYSF